MPGEIKEINVSQLVNYYENPRHAIGSSEEDTLEKLFNAVGIQYMLNLAEDVQKNGLLGNQQIVVVYSEPIQKYVVYEGNRRVAAIKLLIDPDWFKFLDKPTIEKAKKIGQQTGTADGGQATMRGGGNKNLPYFFQGINYGALDPNDAETHGVTAVCRELQLFSDKRLVATYPIATTFLVRSIIEQTIIYYSKKHNIQGQSKLIWENIKDIGKLSKIIENYKRNLPNYITDTTMRQYFTSLFGNYEDNVDPLNWVVHRPAEFQLDVNTLVELPRKGLLSLINFMLS